MSVKKIIEIGKERTGSYAELARRTNSSRQKLNDWKSGKACPPGEVAVLAQLAGVDIVEAVLSELAEREARTDEKKAPLMAELLERYIEQRNAGGVGGIRTLDAAHHRILP